MFANTFTMFASTATGSTLNLNLTNNAGNSTFLMDNQAGGTIGLGGTLGQGSSFFNSDNGNIANNSNTTSGGAPTVTALGTIDIIDPASIPSP